MPFPDVHQGPVFPSNRESPTKPLSTLSPKDMNEMERNPKNRGHSRATSTATAAIERSKMGQEEAEEKAKYYKSLLYNQVEKYEHQLEKYEDLHNHYKQVKETNAHTQAVWEKETRRLRKETFRCQSMIVKLQEELKALRNSVKPAEAELEEQRQRARQREEEAFAARYELISVQEQLARMAERLELAQKERDALRMIVKSEEVIRAPPARQIPLSSANDDVNEDEKMEVLESKPKEQVKADLVTEITVGTTSSAIEEEELDQIKTQMEWERRSAKRAHDLIDFMKIECQFRHCSCRIDESKLKPSSIQPSSIHEEAKPVTTQSPPEAVAPDANFSLLSLIEGPSNATEVEETSVSASDEMVAPTMSREEALEQIRQRRVRSIQL